MSQSRRASIIESLIDSGLSFIIATILNMIVYGGSVKKAMGATVLFTVVSIIRRYYMRRAFVYAEGRGWIS